MDNEQIEEYVKTFNNMLGNNEIGLDELTKYLVALKNLNDVIVEIVDKHKKMISFIDFRESD